MRSSTPSKTSRGLGAQDKSGMIPHFSEHKNISPTILQGTQNHLLLGLPKAPRRAHPTRFSQRVHAHSQSSL